MARQFTEVFPNLKLNKEDALYFEETEIERLTTNRTRDRMRIYLKSAHLIPKKSVFRLERKVREEIFANRVDVKVQEHFCLSAQYRLENLLDDYWDSILDEFRNYSHLTYLILRYSDLSTVDDYLQIDLEDTILAHQKEQEIHEILDKIFCERCGMDVRIRIGFHEPKKKKSAKNAEIQLLNQVREITSRTSMPADEERAEEGQNDVVIAISDPEKNGGKEAKTAADPKENGSVKTAGMSAKANSSKNGADHGQKAAEKKAGFAASQNRELRARRMDRFPKSNNPDVVYGRDFDDDAIALDQVHEGAGEVTIRGKILSLDSRELKNEKTLMIMAISDFTDTIMVKLFLSNEDAAELKTGLKAGGFYKLKGVTTIDRFDGELTIGSVRGIKKIPDFTSSRVDHSAQKRVELHCHTKMSDMDGVSDVKSIIKRAAAWGHKAIAITDHGNVQSFPDANHALDGLDPEFKVIYGVEAYLVDDTRGLVTEPMGQTFKDAYVVFDLETTGLSATACKIIEIGAVRIEEGKITGRFSTFVNPQEPIPYRIQQLTSINDEMVMDAPPIAEVLPQFIEFCRDAVMVAHNADFDMSFIRHNCNVLGLECPKTVLDTVSLSRYLLPNLNRFKLDTVAKALNVDLGHHHRAVDDAECTAGIFLRLADLFLERGIEDLDALAQVAAYDENTIRKLPTYHCIILAKNDIGRVNLYRLVSDSHLKYFSRRPRMPKSEIEKYREGLIIGSACEAGELYQALLNGRSDEDIARLVRFYDYLEIQPVGNNAFMIESDSYEVESEDDIRALNRRVVELGRTFGKPVCATCDVHFLDPEDEIYRRVIMAGQGFDDADKQAPLFLHTTEEMLQEFSYLGSDLAEEVVITNPNRIADMCERIAPVRPDKCPPVIENSDQMLRDICYNKAHEIYGEDLPQIVVERLERELNSIISNGFAVMYIIAQKLVWKSNEDGYLVGSRGSVGSSFVATMAGITEVNPLSPHYLCPNCHYVDFDSPEVKAYGGRAGCDMPDADCPVCGTKLSKLGYDIPFETFLGFKGNKEPDIDLNFSGEYQSKAHKYTEVIFGDGQTFRAGTIGTLADKTAFGFVKKYYEERNQHKRNCEIDRIVSGCIGVRRSTGQHPGGIIVLPLGENIYSFTPIQHPANDMTTDIVTTHFDYHSIDHNLLKLDILGHDDPTMIRMLQDLTGLDPKEIPLDNKEVMSLFQNTEALGITPDDIMGCPLGALGIPEFGTDFAMQMLLDTKPQAFSDLVRISGLSHGTDVWLGNAQTLLKEGVATISTAVCTRDDIMIYLISQGMDSELSFSIMEKVRKGKGLTKEWEEEMKAHGVPDWYIWSCNKIKYMFPKAHAVAYVMMAWRIAYCKVFYPLAYYAAFFSIRATAFDYEIMCFGKERLEHYINDYKRRKDTLSQKEQDTLRDMRIVQEMYARGFEFLPIDIYKAKSKHFQIIDGKLMPSLGTIDGMGEKAAEGVVEAAKDGPFLSKDDFRERTKVSKTVINLMADLGILKDMPESNQLSLFDLQ